MNIKTIVFTILIALVFKQKVCAQNYPALLSGAKDCIAVGVSANPILNANIDYAHQINKLKIKGSPLNLMTQFNTPLFTKKGFDYDLTIGFGSLIPIKKQFNVLAGVSLPFMRTSDLNASYCNLAYKLDLYPGYYTDKWMFGTHFSWQYMPNVFIKNKVYAKNSFENLYTQGTQGKYTKPQDGWFWQNGHVLRLGLSLSYFKPKWNLNLTGDFQYTYNKLGILMFPDIGILPFYGGLNFTHIL